MEKEKSKIKRKTQDSLVTSVIVVAALIAFIGGYALSADLQHSYFNVTSNNNKKDVLDGVQIAGTSVGGSIVAGTTLGFNENYVVSSDDYDYNLDLGSYSSVSTSYLNFEYGDTKSDIKVKRYYYENNGSDEYTISFDKNVVDVHISNFESDPDYNVVLFLLDDGSIEYLLLERAITNNNFTAVSKIDNLSNVVKFYDGTACESGTPICTKTVFAQTTNGSIFDLYSYIVK
jgi:hypothetical protein